MNYCDACGGPMRLYCATCNRIQETDEDKILEVLRYKRRSMYGTVIAELADVPQSTTYRKLHKLMRDGLVVKVGQNGNRQGFKVVPTQQIGN